MDSDPYAILNLPYSADEITIQKAFQEKMKNTIDQESLIEAYGRIRDASGRKNFRWSDFRYCEAPVDDPKISIDLEALIYELAFLSPWEMGDQNV